MMYIPGFQTFRRKPKPSGAVSGQVDKLKKLGKWRFRTGAPAELQLGKCPGCGEDSCHYIGGGPKDIECLNRDCEFFKLPPGTKEPAALDFDFGVDWGIGNP